MRADTAIAGIGLAGIGEAFGFSEIEILAMAAKSAADDAGLNLKEIDGIATASIGASMWVMPVVEYLGIRPSYIDGTMIGGSSFMSHLLPAARAIIAGQCSNVLVCYGSTQRTSKFGRQEIVAARRYLDPQPYEYRYQPVLPVSSYALAASRHMYEYGTTREQLAHVAVSAREWAELHPLAFAKGPLTLEEVLSSRPISSPLTVRDCCLVTDGAGAFILTSSSRAKDLRKKPVFFLGGATEIWHRQISSMHDLTHTAAQVSGKRAYEMAGLSPSEIDVVSVYDAFTINVLLFLEDLGFCKKGEAGAFVESGAIKPGGSLPVNTNGGGLSFAHPGMFGIFQIIEVVEQLRHEAKLRQVKSAEVGLVHGNGGTLSSQSTAIFSNVQR
jgi:acetyl-CoA acetyltransferase